MVRQPSAADAPKSTVPPVPTSVCSQAGELRRLRAADPGAGQQPSCLSWPLPDALTAATMTRKFNLTLFRPDHPRFRIMDSHLEVMHSLQWGFQALGMDCTMCINQIDAQRTNIVFGWIIGAQLGALAQLPPDSILYNFEQFSEREIAGTPMAELTQRFQIWDYSALNLPRWQA